MEEVRRKQAFRLHQQLGEVVAKRDEWREKDKETPQEERERLLRQVKEDNQEIASMDKRTSELQERLSMVQDHVQQVEQDLEEVQGERSAKYRELKKREETMREFLDTFEESKAAEQERIRVLQFNVVGVLEHTSQNMKRVPTPGQLEKMQADLDELDKSDGAARSLDVEHAKLQMDLLRVEELEGKITAELKDLKDSIETMTREIDVFADLEGLQTDEVEKRRLLMEEKDKLLERRDATKKRTQDTNAEYEQAKAQLESNDTYTQLGNLERKWQHHEQNNFVMKEYIAARQCEGNYQQVAQEVTAMMKDYNGLLCQTMSGGTVNS